MNELSDARLKAIREAMNSALVAVAKKHGLSTLVAGHVTYTRGGAFTFKVEGLVAGGTPLEEAVYESLKRFYTELPAFGGTFTHDGRVFEVVGAKQRGKRQVIGEYQGQRYLFAASYVEGQTKKK